MLLRWFRVEDADRNQVALVEATDVREAGRVYLDEYRPDLYIGFANDEEVADWKAHPVPWTDSDILSRIQGSVE